LTHQRNPLKEPLKEPFKGTLQWNPSKEPFKGILQSNPSKQPFKKTFKGTFLKGASTHSSNTAFVPLKQKL
jgi:hypothetical protein